MELKDILITTELMTTRKSRPIDIFAERRGLNLVARRISYGRDAIFQALCELALELCDADSAGISVLHETAEDSGFTLDAVAGRLEGYLGVKAPRHHSPCGVCVSLGTTQLFSRPERYFTWMQQADLAIVEGLGVPLYKEGRVPYGTIWIMLHGEGRYFDREDARIMTVLGEHASAALQVLESRAGCSG